MKEQREILFRLMKKLPDGSHEVVGYMKLEGGKVWHTTSIDIFPMDDWTDIRKGCDSAIFDCIGDCEYIPHDRIDQYTGRDLENGTKVFERDEIEVTVWDGDNAAIIEFKNGAFVAVFEHAECYLSNELKNIKITGVSGVNKSKGEPQCKQPVQ